MGGRGLGALRSPSAHSRSATRPINCSYSSQFISRAHFKSSALKQNSLNGRERTWRLTFAFGSLQVGHSPYKLLLFVAVYKQGSLQVLCPETKFFKWAGEDLAPYVRLRLTPGRPLAL